MLFRSDVFLVATANDLSLLPPELLRKGRFDEIFFVDLPAADERRQIWEIHLRKRNQDAKTHDLDALVTASEGFSGAEIEQAVIAGLYRSLHANAALTTAMLLDEVRETRPLIPSGVIVSSGSARATIAASGTVSSSPSPRSVGVWRSSKIAW